jgi:hypothetical protein
MGVQPEVWFNSCKALWDIAGLMALGVLLMYITTLVVVLPVVTTGKELPMKMKQRIERMVWEIASAILSFASSVVASIVGSACPAP